jgi:adenine-specific DNA glycosylase
MFVISETIKKNIKKKLFKWWRSGGKREFPWRETNDPYNILIAEILLHRTKATQIISLYKLFLDKFPNIYKNLLLDPSGILPEYQPKTVIGLTKKGCI